jgi:S-adenosylmethionine/arginine decarboxylase-like enzyme
MAKILGVHGLDTGFQIGFSAGLEEMRLRAEEIVDEVFGHSHGCVHVYPEELIACLDAHARLRERNNA